MQKVDHEKSDIDVSFEEHLILLEKSISKLLHIHFGLVTPNQNKSPSIRTLQIVKMLQCSTKETISLLQSQST